MIEHQDVIFFEENPVVLENGVRLTASKIVASRPSGILIESGSKSLKIPNFAGLTFNYIFGMLPSLETISWKESLFIIGLPAIVVTSGESLLKHDLFRESNEDSGFYTTEWIEECGLLFCIYESGILAFDDDSHLLWHIEKSWDDTFTGFEKGDLVLMESDEQLIVIDHLNGSRKPRIL